jgi:hypothetical protein
MVRTSIMVAVGVAVCGLCTEVWADELRGTRFEPSEVQHHVRVVLDRGYAKLFVERVVFNPGDKTDQAVYDLALPEGAVATSLKTLGTLHGQPHWFFGELKEAEEAARLYQELTGIGGHYPKDPALLSWVNATDLMLQVFPCMPKQNKALGYTLELPMTYEAGRYRVQLSYGGIEGRAGEFTVEAAHPGDRLFLDDRPLEAGRVVPLTGEQAFALEPRGAPGVDGELAVAETGLGRTFAHVRYALSKQLSQVPNGAYVVLGLDNSRSMGERRRSAVTMAEATLKLFRNARVQILDYDRRPRQRFVGFVPEPTALSSLRRELDEVRVPEPGNGSEVDLALAEAERLLSTAPKTVAKRMLFFTDTLAPPRISPGDLSAGVGKSGAIVHIIHVEGSVPEDLARADEHPWAPAALLTGGLMWEGTEAHRELEQRPNPYLQLVRPTRLDKAVYSFSALPEQDEELGTLEEGSGFERQGLYAGDVRWARITGELWSRPLSVTAHPDPKAGKRWSALVFGTEQREELSEPEMMVLAQRGGAVSPVTSYFATEPGVRPSTEGLDWDEFGDASGAGGLGLSGIGEGGGGRGEGIGLGDAFDPQAFLTKQLAEKWRSCKGTPDTASVTLETHYVEVADVIVDLDAKASSDGTVAAETEDDSEKPGKSGAEVLTERPRQYECLREAAWSLDLRGYRFEDEQHTWEVRI